MLVLFFVAVGDQAPFSNNSFITLQSHCCLFLSVRTLVSVEKHEFILVSLLLLLLLLLFCTNAVYICVFCSMSE